MMTMLYTSLANRFATSIDSGIYEPGDKLPGVRLTSQKEGLSASTVVAAYQLLERDGYIEAKPRSGFYVRTRQQSRLLEPSITKPSKKPQPVTSQSLVLQLIQGLSNPEICQLGANVPDDSFLPSRQVERAVSRAMKDARNWNSTYEAPPGYLPLRQEIAKRLTKDRYVPSPEDITITSGCQEAIYLTLKSTTKPGDIVAIESPTYYGLLQVIESLGLKALEIPTDPRTGMSIEALQIALEKWPIRACVVVANFSNPLGALMPENQKKALVELINRYPKVYLVEDDIYGDLNFSGPRPSTLKSLDVVGNVVHCSSVSKTLSSGLRVGWIVNEKLSDTLQYQKFVTNCATNTLGQHAVTQLLATGNYDRHLKVLRIQLAQNINRILEKVGEYFPAEARVTRPAGGMSLWIELPQRCKTTELANKALEQKISIAPGAIFSSSGKYQNCMRLNCAVQWSSAVDGALRELGILTKSMS